MKTLTTEILTNEYNNWLINNKNGRNSEDLRFGQYLHINYNMDNLTDVFYKESATDAFNILLKNLIDVL